MTHEEFEKVVDHFVKDDNIRTCTKEVLKRVNDKFYKAAASSTGKYHPDYALGDGGLVRHTIAACLIAEELGKLDKFFDINLDYCMAALILHDTCKSGIEWESKYSKFEHPNLAAELVEKTFANNEGDIEREFVAEVVPTIRSHMGQWNTSSYSSIILDLPRTNEQCFVHLCDYLASRKCLEVNFDTIDFNVY